MAKKGDALAAAIDEAIEGETDTLYEPLEERSGLPSCRGGRRAGRRDGRHG
jgi:hypothetical protein